MRKIYIIVGILVLITGVIVMFSSRYGVSIGNITIAPHKDKKILEDLTFSFWEDIQFKDWDTAASYHAEQVKAERDIPYLIERMFQVKPETLDVRNIEVQEVDIDSSGDRGRVRTKLLVKVLNTGKVKQPEAVLYWYKENGQWLLNLESSLRKAEQDKSKPKRSQ